MIITTKSLAIQNPTKFNNFFKLQQSGLFVCFVFDSYFLFYLPGEKINKNFSCSSILLFMFFFIVNKYIFLEYCKISFAPKIDCSQSGNILLEKLILNKFGLRKNIFKYETKKWRENEIIKNIMLLNFMNTKGANFTLNKLKSRKVSSKLVII